MFPRQREEPRCTVLQILSWECRVVIKGSIQRLQQSSVPARFPLPRLILKDRRTGRLTINLTFM